MKLVPHDNNLLWVISPVYGTLRCCTLPRQQPAPQFLQQVFLLPIQYRFSFLPRGVTETFCYCNLAKFSHLQYPSDKAEARITNAAVCRDCLYQWHYIYAIYTWWHQCLPRWQQLKRSVCQSFLILNKLSENLPFSFGINVACMPFLCSCIIIYCEYGPIQMHITGQVHALS